MLACPECHSAQVHASRRRGLIERKILATIQVRPFRCETCDSRFFRWSYSPKPNSSQSVTSRVARWLRLEDDVNAGGTHRV
jgi:hypothetical protein